MGLVLKVMRNDIARLLRERDVSVNRFAREIGISRDTATNLIAGRTSSISFELMVKLRQYFGVTLDDLFFIESGQDSLLQKSET